GGGRGALVALSAVVASLGIRPAHAQPGAADPQPARPPAGEPVPGAPGTTSEPGPVGVPVAPPSGPGVGRPVRPPPVSTNPIQLSPREKNELKDIEAEHDRFVAAANEHDARLRAIARREYDARSAELQKRYSERIPRAEADRGRRHTDTIALLEKFLKDHPDHEQFTPDAMFRLADLYIDKADTEVEAQIAAQESAGAPPDGAPDAAALTADYTPSVRLWQDLLTRFPSYRQTP